jgi:histone arginine demethylase JMJD6
VLNLEDSLAVTQNFCSCTNFPEVWRKTRASRKHMANRWLTKLSTHYPHLYNQAIRMNDEDNFEFVFSQKSLSKKAKRKADRRKLKENLANPQQLAAINATEEINKKQKKSSN